MSKLVLIKHAKPLMSEGAAPHEWDLSEEGRGQALALAEALRPLGISAIVSSREPKAAQTAEVVAKALGLGMKQMDGLEEHRRREFAVIAPREFISHMALFFQRPAQRVVGEESADEAAARFGRAVKSAREAFPEGALAVVSHGTVIALHLAAMGAGDGFGLWRQMGNPSFAVIEEGKPVSIVRRLEGQDKQA